MTWRVARSLLTLRGQADAAWPTRSKRSDGTIGDTDHSKRTSDHNPWVPYPTGGVVTALDLTHDPAAGADMHRLAEAIRTDPRVKYLIWDRRIWNPSVSRTWRHYGGANPHTTHMHISVVAAPATAYDSPAPWLVTVPPITEEDDMMRAVKLRGTPHIYAGTAAGSYRRVPTASVLQQSRDAGLIAQGESEVDGPTLDWLTGGRR